MDPIGFVILLVCFFPVWVPILVAIFGRRELLAVRIVLGVSGAVAGLYAGVAINLISRHAGGGGFGGFGLFLVPVRAGILSFYIAFTGLCLMTALHYILVRRSLSIPALAAGLLFVGCILSGTILIPWLLTWPHYD